jgi:hypothetical protein
MKTTNILITTAMTFALTAGALAGDQKAGAPPQPATKEKAPAPEAKKAPEAMKAPEMPKPPQELADMAKMMGGSWKCAGKVAMDPSDPTKMTDASMNLTFKLDMDKWWLKGDMTGKAGPMKMKGTMYTTYEPTSKKWRRFMVDNMGGSEIGWSTGMKDNKVVWEGEMYGMMSGKTRMTEDVSNPKEVKMKAEMSMDGKTWMTGWESTCKR